MLTADRQEAAKERRRLRLLYIKNARMAKAASVERATIQTTGNTAQEKRPSKRITVVVQESDEADMKKEFRKIRNRESAIASRKRKHEESVRLESELEVLKRQVAVLADRLMQYEDPESVKRIMKHVRSTASDDSEDIDMMYHHTLGPAVFKVSNYYIYPSIR